MRKSKENAQKTAKRKIVQSNDDIPGITIFSPSGNWLSDVHLNPHDFAQNHGMMSYGFLEDDVHGSLKIFVTDDILSKGAEEVVRLLVAEAARRWTWRKDNGEPLGRIPTGLEANLWEAAEILCAVCKTKKQMVVDQ